jgi:hypothetical protein
MKRRGFLQFLGMAPAVAVAAVKAAPVEAVAAPGAAPIAGLDRTRDAMQEMLDRNYGDYFTACCYSITAGTLQSYGRFDK